MGFGFLFWLFLAGIIIACFQDLKRREVDNWLNLFLIVSSLVFVFYGIVPSGDYYFIFHVAFFLVFMFAVMNLFYHGRVFAGGDAKLLFAMSAFFLGATFYESLINVGIFILFLMVSGSVYGLGYSGFLWFNNKKKVNEKMRFIAKEMGAKYWFVVAIVLMILGFVEIFLLWAGISVLLILSLYIFSKGIEDVVMIREIAGRDLREGDWLVDDVRVGRNVVKADWDGLSLEDVEILKKRKSVLIKDGLPFVPAFLIAFLFYVLFRVFSGVVLGFLLV